MRRRVLQIYYFKIDFKKAVFQSFTFPEAFRDALFNGKRVKYRKPTFTGQFLRWESFTQIKCNASLVSTLVHRALMICSKNNLKKEINRIKEILLGNGYPDDFVLKHISNKVSRFSNPKPGPARGGFRGYIVPGPREVWAQGARKSSGFHVKFWYRTITS